MAQTKKPRFNPFTPLHGKYGAPMGRGSTNPANFAGLTAAALCVSRPQGEYDSGGAYWGLTPPYQHGANNDNTGPVYAVWARGKGYLLGVCYVRAWGPESAKLKVLSGEA